MSSTPIIFWFRRDPRLADHPDPLQAASRPDGQVTPASIVEATFASPAGPTRVAHLRSTLEPIDRSLGGRLNVRVGEPAHDLLARFAEARELAKVRS